MERVLAAFWSGNYAPHGYCLFWQPTLLWSHIIADTLIAIAYFSIPIALVTLIRRRKDLIFGWIFWCFGLFILACGLTHVMGIITLFYPLYGVEAIVKLITAAASVATAILLWPLLPRLVRLPSSEKLKEANAQLAAMVEQRDAALADVKAEVAQRESVEAALLQAQKLEAVGQLTGGIAHDFNNLLQAIAGNLELIARKPDDADRVIRWTSSALDAVERGRQLTGQLLAFSSKQRLDVKSVRLADLVGGMAGLVERAVAPLSRVRIERIDPVWNVQTDALQLELAILNLAFNARDAMPEGGLLTISAELRSGKVAADLPVGDYVALTVSDTGTGMTPDVLARAVEPFFSTKGVGKGTGMGLSMAFGVMRQSGGTLTIDSDVGRGTAITLVLPIATVEPRRDVQDDAAHDERVDLSGAEVALVDDDDHVRGSLIETLCAAGATVAEAADGESGIALVRAKRYGALVVDFAMPGLSGSEVAEQVAAIDPELPVILITGFADSSKLDAVAPNVTILRKPFESKELLHHIQKVCRR
ncbi:ATP-binding protein [Sphingomonas sp. HT-1]|uniref:ATP-binding protein n=1 Tax=unclassified Sphingomonas TaxID=196159 RepID=UPI0002D6CD1B|nr:MULTISPECIES: ATP-binding protein [unclassified Sphingomonas]KTF69603.1 hybrid sensor histidine kinase/response regulator [Sphingomonas sp. WG]